MNLRFLFALSVLVVATVIIQGGRGRWSSRRGSSRHRGLQGDHYTWSRDIGGGVYADESAHVITNQVYLRSTNDSLTAAGFTKSTTLYDFTTIPPVVAVTLAERRRKSPCYIVPATLDYDGVIAALSSRNASTAPLGTQVDLDILTGDTVSQERGQGLLTSNPSLRRVCKRGRVVITTSNRAASRDGTEVIKVLHLDTVLSITIPSSTRGSRGGSRRGGRGRGGRGDK